MKPLLGALVLLSLSLTTSAYALDVSMSPGHTHITARHEDGSTWATLLATKPTKTEAQRTTPILVEEDAVYACAQNVAYKLRPQDGVVQWRQTLPGDCTAFSREDTHLYVTTHLKFDVEGTHTSKDTKLKITPDGVDTPTFWFSPEHIQQSNRLYELATNVVEYSLNIQQLDYDREKPLCDLTQAPCQDALKNLDIAAKQDPTNPAYLAHKLLILHDNHKDEEAQKTIQQLWNIPSTYHPDLLFLHKALQHRPELYLSIVDHAQKLGISQLIRDGHEPFADHSLITIAATVAVLSNLYTEQELNTLKQDPKTYFQNTQIKHTERMNRIAPGFENSPLVYNQLAQLAQEHHDETAYQSWSNEAKLWPKQGLIGVPFQMVNNAGNMITALSAITLAFLLLLLLKAGRAGALTVNAKERKDIRWNILNRLNRSELTGLLLLPIAATIALYISTQAILAVGMMGQAPFSIEQGQYNHPEAIQWLDQLNKDGHKHEGYTFMRAYSKQLQGNLDEAQNLYTQIKDTDPRALNNLGVIALAKKQDAKAQEYFSQALRIDPNLQEAKYNTNSLDGISTYLIYRHSLDLNIPLAAPPSSSHRAMLIQHHARSQWLKGLTGNLTSLDDNLDGSMNPFKNTWSLAISILLLLVIVHAIIFRPKNTTPTTGKRNTLAKVSWALSSLFPGASRHWGVVGPLMAATFLWTAFMALTLAHTGVSTNVLIAIATPSYSRLFSMDISEAIIAQQGAWLTFAKLWWVFIPINLLFVIAMELRERRKTS